VRAAEDGKISKKRVFVSGAGEIGALNKKVTKKKKKKRKRTKKPQRKQKKDLGKDVKNKTTASVGQQGKNNRGWKTLASGGWAGKGKKKMCLAGSILISKKNTTVKGMIKMRKRTINSNLGSK